MNEQRLRQTKAKKERKNDVFRKIFLKKERK
jgi:hypothetical protein